MKREHAHKRWQRLRDTEWGPVEQNGSKIRAMERRCAPSTRKAREKAAAMLWDAVRARMKGRRLKQKAEETP